MIRVLVADDHPMYRQGVVSVLETAEGMEVVGEAISGEEAVRLALELQPNVVLMDIRMPGLNGIEATARIKSHYSDIQIVVLTMFKDDASVITAMKAGARGYLLKDADSKDIVDAIRSVASGKAIFSGDVANRMIEFATRPSGRLDEFPDLTYREKEVLSLMVEGLSNSEISRALELSTKTISNYVGYILNKLQVVSREQAIHKVKGQS